MILEIHISKQAQKIIKLPYITLAIPNHDEADKLLSSLISITDKNLRSGSQKYMQTPGSFDIDVYSQRINSIGCYNYAAENLHHGIDKDAAAALGVILLCGTDKGVVPFGLTMLLRILTTAIWPRTSK